MGWESSLGVVHVTRDSHVHAWLLCAAHCTTPPLRFSSHFESGNLKRAIRVYDTEYDLILNTDVNSAVHAQWFYYSVEHAQPGVTYRFNIINMEKPHSQFNEGQRYAARSSGRKRNPQQPRATLNAERPIAAQINLKPPARSNPPQTCIALHPVV